MSIPIQYLRSTSGSADIADGLERAVADQALRPGDRLPPVRQLAADLGVAPGTVAAAYRTLSNRGIVAGRGRQGTRVTASPPLAARIAPPIPEGVRNLASGNPDPDLLPPLGAALRRLRPSSVTWGDVHPDLEPWIELAREQLDADGYPAGRVLAVAGALDGVERVLQAHLRPGDRVALEDPGFARVVDLVSAMGLVPVPVAIDDAGIVTDSLAEVLAGGVEALVITPRAQNPYGSATDHERASALGRVLGRHPDLLVVEDDHAGPIAGADAHPIVSARLRRWAVVRSVSKSLGPDLRLAALCGDDITIDRVEGRLRAGPGWVSHLLQSLVVDLWRDERTSARVAVAAERYADRRHALLDALHAHDLTGHGRSGLNVWVPVPNEESVVAGMQLRGWAVSAGERFRLRSTPAVRISIGSLAPADAPRVAGDLAAVLRTGGSATAV